jgi:hypothetical protein
MEKRFTWGRASKRKGAGSWAVFQLFTDLGFAEVANLNAFAKEVFREACKRTSEALRGLWKAIGVLPPPEVEVALRKGYQLDAEFSRPPYGAEPEVEIYVQSPREAAWEDFSLPAPHLVHLENFSLHAWGGGSR